MTDVDDLIYGPIEPEDTTGFRVMCTMCLRPAHMNKQSLNRLLKTCTRGKDCAVLDSVTDGLKP